MWYLLSTIQVVLLTLKLIGYIDCSWWIVLLPLIFSIVIFIGAIVGAIAVAKRKNKWDL